MNCRILKMRCCQHHCNIKFSPEAGVSVAPLIARTRLSLWVVTAKDVMLRCCGVSHAPHGLVHTHMRSGLTMEWSTHTWGQDTMGWSTHGHMWLTLDESTVRYLTPHVCPWPRAWQWPMLLPHARYERRARTLHTQCHTKWTRPEQAGLHLSCLSRLRRK